jgi:hypothetical protein
MPQVTEVSNLTSPPYQENQEMSIKVVSTAGKSQRLSAMKEHTHNGISTQDTMHDSKMTKGAESVED